MSRLLSLLVLSGLAVAAAAAGNARAQDAKEAAIRQTVAAYVEAFNRGDAAGLAACWAEDAEFLTPGGKALQGRAAIQEGFATFFKNNPGAKLDVEIDSIRVEGDSAVEQGSAQVTYADEAGDVSNYVARYVQQDGKWLLASSNEALAPPTHYEQLKELEWLVGTWVDQEEDSTIETVCRWTKNRNFMTRSFSVKIADRIELEGTQVIGWDPAQGVIRSWVFDSDGGFGVGIWSRNGGRWTIRALRELPDGRKASSINTLTRVDENSFTWGSTGREVDGEVLPCINPVTVVRKTEAN